MPTFSERIKEIFNDPVTADYLTRAGIGAGVGALAGGGLGALQDKEEETPSAKRRRLLTDAVLGGLLGGSVGVGTKAVPSLIFGKDHDAPKKFKYNSAPVKAAVAVRSMVTPGVGTAVGLVQGARRYNALGEAMDTKGVKGEGISSVSGLNPNFSEHTTTPAALLPKGPATAISEEAARRYTVRELLAQIKRSPDLNFDSSKGGFTSADRFITNEFKKFLALDPAAPQYLDIYQKDISNWKRFLTDLTNSSDKSTMGQYSPSSQQRFLQVMKEIPDAEAKELFLRVAQNHGVDLNQMSGAMGDNWLTRFIGRRFPGIPNYFNAGLGTAALAGNVAPMTVPRKLTGAGTSVLGHALGFVAADKLLQHTFDPIVVNEPWMNYIYGGKRPNFQDR